MKDFYQFHTALQQSALHNEHLLKILTPEQIAKITSTNGLVAGALTTGLFVALLCYVFGPNNGSSAHPSKKSKKKLKKKKKTKELPQALLRRLMGETLATVDSELVPQVDKWEKDLKDFEEEKSLLSKEDSEKGASKLGFMYKYLEETILKELLKMDAIEHHGEEDLRAERKRIIKHIQSLHKRIDGVKKESKVI